MEMNNHPFIALWADPKQVRSLADIIDHRCQLRALHEIIINLACRAKQGTELPPVQVVAEMTRRPIRNEAYWSFRATVGREGRFQSRPNQHDRCAVMSVFLRGHE